ncbi:MAG: response regulator [Thermoguttaceae bacterium]|nr:response regulator [Thermoguttaceae bacterium]
MTAIASKPEKTVLIVDSSEETRDVLSTVLARRGVRAITSATSRRGAVLARQTRPDLVVFDVETEVYEAAKDGQTAVKSFVRNADLARSNVPIVAIGSAKFEIPSEGEFVAKPYHFAPLLEKIERLLNEAENRAAAENK